MHTVVEKFLKGGAINKLGFWKEKEIQWCWNIVS